MKNILKTIALIIIPIIMVVCLMLIIKDNNDSVRRDLESIDPDGWEYIQLENDTYGKFIVITGYHGNEDDTLSIPGQINNTDVKILKGYIFGTTFKLSKLIIPKEIEKITEKAFSFPEINEIEFEEGSHLRDISGGECFSVRKCEKIVLPDSLEEIGDGAFAYSFDLKSIYIGKNVKHIGDGAFYNTKLSEITISPDNEFYSYDDGMLIEKETSRLLAFDHEKYGIDSTLQIPDYIKDIDTLCIYGIAQINVEEKNEQYASYNGCLYDKTGTVLYRVPDNMSYEDFSFHEGIEKIEGNAFHMCYLYNDIYIPDTVKSIERDAFSSQNLYISSSMEFLCLQTFFGSIHYAGTEEQWNNMTVLDAIALDGSDKRMYDLYFEGEE